MTTRQKKMGGRLGGLAPEPQSLGRVIPPKRMHMQRVCPAGWARQRAPHRGPHVRTWPAAPSTGGHVITRSPRAPSAEKPMTSSEGDWSRDPADQVCKHTGTHLRCLVHPKCNNGRIGVNMVNMPMHVSISTNSYNPQAVCKHTYK